MKKYFGLIRAASTTEEVCAALEGALAALRAGDFFDEIPDYYQVITATSPDDVQNWFDDLKIDGQIEEQGALKAIYDLYHAALAKLRELGFHRVD
jgi:hypothetical protein